jgi:hypothetical protein
MLALGVEPHVIGVARPLIVQGRGRLTLEIVQRGHNFILDDLRAKTEFLDLGRRWPLRERNTKTDVLSLGFLNIDMHMPRADDLFGTPQGSPRTDKVIDARIQWAERIMQKIDEVVR